MHVPSETIINNQSQIFMHLSTCIRFILQCKLMRCILAGSFTTNMHYQSFSRWELLSCLTTPFLKFLCTNGKALYIVLVLLPVWYITKRATFSVDFTPHGRFNKHSPMPGANNLQERTLHCGTPSATWCSSEYVFSIF